GPTPGRSAALLLRARRRGPTPQTDREASRVRHTDNPNESSTSSTCATTAMTCRKSLVGDGDWDSKPALAPLRPTDVHIDKDHTARTSWRRTETSLNLTARSSTSRVPERSRSEPLGP